MKRILSGFIVSMLFSASLHASFQSGADKLINQVDPAINIGVEVVDLTSGATIYRRNQNRSFIPASNMKLFSDAAALMVLGPDYRFRNQLSAGVSRLKDGVFKGTIYLKLPGDPSFTRARLASLLASLKSWHINRIIGNVVIDSSHVNIHPYAPGWMVEDLAYSYGAPLAPVIIDANRMTVTVNPGNKPGAPAIVELPKDIGGIAINNQVKTKASAAKCGVDFSMDKDNQLTVRGCVGVNQWAIQQNMAVRNPLAYAQGLIQKQLNRQGIVLEGEVVLGKTPSGSMMLATDLSKPVAQLMADTLKPSDNLYADSLFLHAASKLQGAPVNWSEAQILIKKFIQQQTGIPLKNAVMTDGSGLSRYDLLTPSQTVGLLRFLYERFPLSYEYIAALPISGRDGTLQRRFKKPNQKDMVRAKTGTMRGVVSLSGYLYTANAHTLAFAIYINNLPGTKLSVSGRYRYLVDALCSYFLQQKPANNSWVRVLGKHPRLKYQQNPTQSEIQRRRNARWRRLETLVKQALKGQSVTVLYRNNELILRDHQVDFNKVMQALSNVRKKHPFAVAVASKTIPNTLGRPLILWTDVFNSRASEQRVWTIREASS
ncbi:D-alanyl-D-alanine carboxypeptidase/D-alanyl-D-alanine endopeptidase [Legionella spiritensis]|uniref:D-alanyl-D-alanine carboxypeptidase n=1 Tax=Legionella spiritensis TaxID=452 RepID=A0A0W0Z672_LEGSP|nr:D-alanyl-D-alanine carboxypeptidase/D-alanyl-D-alanine-endopeptidase [Legionella spiritensis]KTD64617.1 D-alanyl-D-alanine carboxypeptidase [Legionella spiritensis]SNV47430.1 D-alanyl-D-alanine carboxypeptidase [Legionella spiritensis]